MRKLSMAVVSAILLCGFSLAQQTATPTTDTTNATQSAPQGTHPNAPTQPNASASQNPRIAPGSVIPVQLTKGIDAKKAKAGDAVEARVTQDMKSSNGELIVAKDTKVTGHITEAQAHTKDQKESEVGIAFDHAVMKDGHDVSLPMSIQAIISPQALPGNSNSGNSASSPSEAGTSQAGSPGRPSGMGGASSPANRPSGTNSPTNEPDSGTAANNKPNQPITGNTQGVVGIEDMKLSTAAPNGQGSMVTSDKKNVKLDNGTLMLLRVNQ